MRAGVLSNDQIIAFLNENFINTWVPNSELGRTPSLRDPIVKRRKRESKEFDTTHPLAQAIITGWKDRSPVDCLIISPQFEVIGKQPINEFLFSGGVSEQYLTFLKEALDGKLPGFEEETPEPQSTDSEIQSNSQTVPLKGLNVVLTHRKHEREILNVLRAPGHGYQDYTVIHIDATAFENGGLLAIDISLGHAEAAGSFALFDGGSELPTEGEPQNALASIHGILPDEKGIITYDFDRSQVFKLGATGAWSSKKGSVNAFWAKISVEPDRKPEPKKVPPSRLEQSAEDVMNAFVKAFKNLDGETLLPMLTGDARETFEGDFADVPEDMRAQISEMLSEMEILSSEYVGDEFHFRLRVPMAPKQELSVKIRKVEGIWLIYDAK